MSIAPQTPQSQEAERAILSAALQGADLTSILKEIATDDFFSLLHRRVYAQMRRMRDDGEQLNLVTLCESMSLDSVETAAVADLLSPSLVIRTDSDVLSYARIVKTHSSKRKLLVACEQVIQSNGDAPLLAAELQTKTRHYLDSLQSGGGESTWREVFHSFEEFESAAPLNFAIEGFLQCDGATMIGGLSGHGKTLILLSIAKALLGPKGARLWDLFPVIEPAVRVVYLIPECSISPFKHRLGLFRLYDHLRPEDGRLLVRTLSKGSTPCLSDSRILYAAKGAHVILDTAVRFNDGDENSAGDNQRGLAKDIFALLAAGARSVIGAHHSPKPFARENHMGLENVLRGSGDVGAMLTTAWGVKQLDAEQNVIHIQNCKPRDFQPCSAFQIIGRPFIDQVCDFQLHKRPGECGDLADEQPGHDKGGAHAQARESKAANKGLLREWLGVTPGLTSHELSQRFSDIGIKLGDSAIRKYRKDLGL